MPLLKEHRIAPIFTKKNYATPVFPYQNKKR